MTTATTPKGRTVEVTTEMCGTKNQAGTLWYGGIKVGYWVQIGSPPNNLSDALVNADTSIDKNGLTDDTGAMSVRDVPESLRLIFRGKALQEGKTMQAKIIELMQKYVEG
jgi:hypothetical protein